MSDWPDSRPPTAGRRSRHATARRFLLYLYRRAACWTLAYFSLVAALSSPGWALDNLSLAAALRTYKSRNLIRLAKEKSCDLPLPLVLTLDPHADLVVGEDLI